ncbi:MAG: hypothetical protein WBE28_11920 [bacterium]
MVTATNNILLRGGVLVLLPLLASSYSPYKYAGLHVGYTITDNINQLNLRDAGQIISASPFFFYSGFLQFDYAGDVSLINFESANLLVANDIKITKIVLIPGIGNRTAIYADIYSFYIPSFEQYRIFDIIAGNSLHAYFGNYPFSLDIKVRHKHYVLDSLNDYLEPSLDMTLGIPLPYSLFTPDIEIGCRKYLEEFVPFYSTGSELFFPFTLDFSVAMGMKYLRSSQPQNDYIIPLRYVDDPFFEEENISELFDLDVSVTRTIAKKRIFAEAKLSLFHKVFYEIEDLERIDKGLQLSVRFTKFINDNLRLHVNGNTEINTSTIEDFDYMKNEVDLNLELIF